MSVMGRKAREKRLKSPDISAPHQPRSSEGRGLFTATVLIIAIISAGVYANTLSNGFVHDDNGQVLENLWITDLKFIPDMFTSSVWSFVKNRTVVSNYYRPMMHLIYNVTYHIFGLNPWGFHLVNIVIHSLISVMVFIITKRLLEQTAQAFVSQPTRTGGISSVLPAFGAALLFATHPVHTEAVAWIACVPELSYTLFFLLSFYFFMLYEEGKKGMYALSVAAFAIAVFSKEPALLLPFVLMVYEYIFHRRPFSNPETPRFAYAFLKRYLPYFAIGGVYMVLRIHALGGVSPAKGNVDLRDSLSGFQYAINIFPLFISYLGKLLLPLNLNAWYVFHPVRSLLDVKTVAAIAVTVVFFLLPLAAKRLTRFVYFCLCLIVVPLLPVLYIPAILVPFAERYLYLPSFGFVLLAAMLLSKLLAVRSPLIKGASISILLLLVGLYSIGTAGRNTVWRDDLTLFTDMVKKSPDAAIPHNDLGSLYAAENRLEEAVTEYKEALKLKPDYGDAHYNLGVIYHKQNRLDEAIKEYTEALRLIPDYPEAHNNLGSAYTDKNRVQEALAEYKAALKLRPDYPEAHYNLGRLYQKQNRLEEAIAEFKTAIKLKPGHVEAHNDLGCCYMSRNRADEAVAEFQAAARLKPDYPDAHFNLGVALAAQDRFREAADAFKEAVRLNPDSVYARRNLEVMKEKIKNTGGLR